MLDPHIAYLTSDAALTTPFVSSFRVREALPADTRDLARHCASARSDASRSRSAGWMLDPAALRESLKLRGDGSATLVLTRVGGKRVAILRAG